MKMNGGSAPERDGEIAQVPETFDQTKKKGQGGRAKTARQKKKGQEGRERIEKVGENMPSYSLPWATLSN